MRKFNRFDVHVDPASWGAVYDGKSCVPLTDEECKDRQENKDRLIEDLRATMDLQVTMDLRVQERQDRQVSSQLWWVDP